jgi:hypothetical protein
MTTSKIKTHAIESESCKEEKVIILIRTNANAALATRKPKLWHPCSVSPMAVTTHHNVHVTIAGVRCWVVVFVS